MSYTPLTKEQFQKARQAGFSPDQITANEQKRKAKLQVPQNPQDTFDVKPAPNAQATKIANAQSAAAQSEQASQEANSPLGFAKNFGKAFVGNVGNLVGSEVGLGQSIAKIAQQSHPTYLKSQQKTVESNNALLAEIQKNKKAGFDTSRLERAFNSGANQLKTDTANVAEQGNLPSTQKVVAQIAGTALDVLTAGTYGKATQGMKPFQMATKLPVGTTVATAAGLPELGAIAQQKASGLFTKKGVGNIAKGAGIGYAYDVTQGSQGARGEDRTGVNAFIPGAGTALGAALPAVSETVQSVKNQINKGYMPLSKESRDVSLVTKRANELDKLDSYQSLTKAIEKGRERGIDIKKVLSETDVLHGSVDNTGLITTKGEGAAIEQYTKKYIDGNEAIVSDALKKEGRSISLEQVRSKLRQQVMDAGIEGDALESALLKVDKEVAGYARRGGNSGTVPVSTLHSAKVDKYNSINFFTEGNTKKYDKTVAKALKELVEDNTTSVKVKDINTELSKHFAVVDYLEKLDNKKVEGGKLGKYFARTIGAVVGSHFGPLGAIVGAEGAGVIKGGAMSRAFNGKTGKSIPQAQSIVDANKVLDAAPLQLPPSTQSKSNSAGNLNSTQTTTIAPIKKAITPTVPPATKPSSKLSAYRDGKPNSESGMVNFFGGRKQPGFHQDDVNFFYDRVYAAKNLSDGDFRRAQGVLRSKGMEAPKSKKALIEFVEDIFDSGINFKI